MESWKVTFKKDGTINRVYSGYTCIRSGTEFKDPGTPLRRWFRNSWCWESVSYIQIPITHSKNEDENMWAKEKRKWMIKDKGRRHKLWWEKRSCPWICVLTLFYPGSQLTTKSVVCTVNCFEIGWMEKNRFFF